MPKASKLVDIDLVQRAEASLKSLGKYGVVAHRLQAIIALYKHGFQKVSEVYDIDKSSLHRWTSRFKNGNEKSLENLHKPPRSKISAKQAKTIESWICSDNTLTIQKICKMIKDKWELDVSKSTIHRLIQKLGFSHITGRKSHYKSDPELQEEFKKKSTNSSKK